MAVVAVARVQELGEVPVGLGAHRAEPGGVVVEHGEVVVGDVPDAGVGDAQLDQAAGAEQLVGQLDGQRRGQVAPVGGAGDDVLAREADQRVGDVARLQVQRLRHLRQVQRPVERHAAGQHELADRLVRLLLADALQPAEPPAEVRQRRTLPPGGDRDVGQEHRVRAARHGLGDPALQVRERAAQHRHAVDARVVARAGELVALARELVGEVLLALGEDVDAERPGLEQGGLGLAGLVQADQHHGRLHGQRADRTRGGAHRRAVDGRRDHRDAAQEPADDVPEDLLVGQGRLRARAALDAHDSPPVPSPCVASSGSVGAAPTTPCARSFATSSAVRPSSSVSTASVSAPSARPAQLISPGVSDSRGTTDCIVSSP